MDTCERDNFDEECVKIVLDIIREAKQQQKRSIIISPRYMSYDARWKLEKLKYTRESVEDGWKISW